MTFFRLHEAGGAVWIAFLVTLAGVLVLATVLTYGVERPALGALRGWHRRGRRAEPARA